VSQHRSEGPDHPDGMPPEDGPAKAARRRPAVLSALAVAIVLAVVLAAAFVPRTVAEGGQGDATWRVRVAPGLWSPSVRLDGTDGTVTAPRSGGASLDATVVWQRPSGDTVATIVVGPTPREARSIRVTSAERGVGEAAVQRVLWRRVHVWVIDQPVTVTDLVSIGRDGQVLDVVRDVPPPDS
jgi:hypothetical protein